MESFLQGKTTAKNKDIKAFGYLISAFLIMVTTIAMMARSALTPWLFMLTMYVLTGALWAPTLIRPIYKTWLKLSAKQHSQNNNQDSAKNSS